MTLTPLREHRAVPVPATAISGRPTDLLGRRSVLSLGLALLCLGATAVITAAPWQVLPGGRPAQGIGTAMMCPVALALLLGALPAGRRARGIAPAYVCAGAGMLALPSGGGWLPAEYGRPGPFAVCAGLMAALLAPAPALPHPPGTERHVPDLVGSVLLASAVAAGVLANSRGSAWGRLSSRLRVCAASFAVRGPGGGSALSTIGTGAVLGGRSA
ncbi:MFS transporter [Nonomuraea sp. KM90]|uniref:MFS transporter n=1 Tax=Nonomuraea sp. KM90 TaxID=3457428 RepID=UPI003FCCBAAD